MSTNETPAVEMTMQPNEFADLRAHVAEVFQTDVKVGRVLEEIILHLGHAHGLDPAVEDAKAKAAALQAARDEEDARLKAEADARAKARTAQDAQVHTPEQQAALTNARTAEDAQLAADAEALAKARAEEDAAAKEQPAQAVVAEPAPEAFPAPGEAAP